MLGDVGLAPAFHAKIPDLLFALEADFFVGHRCGCVGVGVHGGLLLCWVWLLACFFETAFSAGRLFV